LRAAALEERDVRARVAVLEALGSLGPDEGRASLAEDVFAEGQSYAVRAAAAALLCRADPPRAFEFVTRGLALPSPHDALAARLLGVLARLDDPRVVETLRACATDRSRAPTARVAAVEALAGLATQRSWSAHELAALLGEPSFSLRQAVVAALTTIGDASAQRSLAEYYPRSRTALERRWIESLLERSEL
jgi:HEAT repeat protein